MKDDLLAEVRAENLVKARAARKGNSARKSRAKLLQETTCHLKGARVSAVEQRASQVPERALSTYLKAVRGRSLRAAADAFCMECVCWQRKEVRNCTSLACPLWPYRPYQTP